MHTIERIKDQATIAGLADYLLYADSPDIENDMNYDARADRAFSECKKVLLRYDQNEESELINAVYKILGEYERIYTELGLCFGLMLKDDLNRFSLKNGREVRQGDERDAGILDRINLQALGAFIRNGDRRKILDRDSFERRELKAYESLEHELLKYMKEEEMATVEERLNHYTAVMEEIQFTLGMRAGAGLILQLTSDRNHDC